jgi:glycosyltransferase involved in cell wall biosynthesis
MDNINVQPPLVSVLMTAFNREAYIGTAINSVLSSSFRNFELIIVDDCSKDNTVAICREYARADDRIKLYVNEQNLGDYPNRNKAASLATGRYIKYVDSDDMIYSYGLEVFVSAMESYPDAVLGITSRNPIPLSPFPVLLSPEAAYQKHFFQYGMLDYGPSGVIIRRDVFQQYGGFSSARYVGDQECWFRLAARHSILELPPALTFWRQHEGQEFKAGMQGIDSGYFMMNLPLLRDVLNSPYCPLTQTEKRQILRQQQRQYARQLAKHLLKTGQVRKVVTKMKTLQLSATDMI